MQKQNNTHIHTKQKQNNTHTHIHTKQNKTKTKTHTHKQKSSTQTNTHKPTQVQKPNYSFWLASKRGKNGYKSMMKLQSLFFSFLFFLVLSDEFSLIPLLQLGDTKVYITYNSQHYLICFDDLLYKAFCRTGMQNK